MNRGDVFLYHPAVMDYEVQRSTRRCAATDREFRPGEAFYSTLVAEEAQLVRRDYAVEAWRGPPEGIVGWWKSRMPDASGRTRLAPSDVLLELFDQLEAQPDKQDLRYLLTLLLVRRRVMRVEESGRADDGRDTLVVYCPRREATYDVFVSVPDETRTARVQEELGRLLYAG